MLDYTALTPTVERAAHIAASKFPDHHDINDVKQTLWVWVMENKGTVTRICEDSLGADTALIELLLKAANSHLKTEEAAVYGYDERDQYNYTIPLIKNILEVIFRYEDWQSFAVSQDTQPRAKKNPAHGGDNLASYADVKSAVEKLPDDQYNAVVWRYKYSYTFRQLGNEAGVSERAAGHLLEGAVSAIQRILGKRDLAEFRRGHSGRQEARNSVSGQARVERDYDGG